MYIDGFPSLSSRIWTVKQFSHLEMCVCNLKKKLHLLSLGVGIYDPREKKERSISKHI